MARYRLLSRWLLMLLSLFLVIIVMATGLGWYLSAPGYQGPVTDHFDGKRFYNPSGASTGSFSKLLKWMTNRQQGEWTYEAVQSQPVKPLNAEDDIVVTFVNHSTFLIQVDGLNILTDPVWSERVSPFTFAGPKRMQPPGLDFDSLPPIDIILLSHNHYDHMDIPTLQRLFDRYSPTIVTPLGNSAFLHQQGIGNSHDLDWWESINIKGLDIHCTPAQHFSSRGMFDRDKTLWGGFVLATSAGKVYYAGDSGYGPFFQDIGSRLGPMAVSIIPIGAFQPEWFMSPIHISPAEALQVHIDVQSKQSIACHFGTFPLADDGMLEPINQLQQAINRTGFPENAFLVLDEGASWKQVTEPTMPIP